MALNAGTDSEMTSTLIRDHGAQLVADRRVSMARIDDAVRRILRVKFRAGLFEHPYVDVSRAPGAQLRPDAVAAAEALGLTPLRALREVELPLAAPVVLSALRVALATSVGTAAVGALAGAETLGTPIVLGLQNQNQLLVLQGAAATAALAFLADGALLLLGGRASPPAGRAA